MKVTLIRIWASPSTLHLRVMVSAKGGAWAVFRDIHVPKEELPVEDLASFADMNAVDDVEPEVQPGFW